MRPFKDLILDIISSLLSAVQHYGNPNVSEHTALALTQAREKLDELCPVNMASVRAAMPRDVLEMWHRERPAFEDLPEIIRQLVEQRDQANEAYRRNELEAALKARSK